MRDPCKFWTRITEFADLDGCDVAPPAGDPVVTFYDGSYSLVEDRTTFGLFEGYDCGQTKYWIDLRGFTNSNAPEGSRLYLQVENSGFGACREAKEEGFYLVSVKGEARTPPPYSPTLPGGDGPPGGFGPRPCPGESLIGGAYTCRGTLDPESALPMCPADMVWVSMYTGNNCSSPPDWEQHPCWMLVKTIRPMIHNAEDEFVAELPMLTLSSHRAHDYLCS